MANDYWEQRVLADERRATEIARNASDELAKMYRTQYLRVVKEIEKLKGEIDYGAELTRTQLWNYARWRKVEESLRDCVAESTRIGTEVIHAALEKEFERVIGDKVMNYGGAIGRNGMMALTQLEKNRILSGTWSGDHYSARIWKNTSAVADRMRNEITNMLVDGKSTQDIRRTVMREFGVGYHNADRLVRTEVSYVHNQMTLARYKANGDSLVKILNVEDGKACEICRELPGKPYDINAAPFLPAHPRCRCCYAPWTYSDRKKWAKEHPEEGTEAIANRSKIPNGSDGQNGPNSLQNQGFTGIMETKEHVNHKREIRRDEAFEMGLNAYIERLRNDSLEEIYDIEQIVKDAKQKGGRHFGKYIDAQTWKESSVRKAIQSFRMTAEEHRAKILDPERFDGTWNDKTEQEKIGLLMKWQKDEAKNWQLWLIMLEVARERGIHV